MRSLHSMQIIISISNSYESSFLIMMGFWGLLNIFRNFYDVDSLQTVIYRYNSQIINYKNVQLWFKRRMVRPR